MTVQNKDYTKTLYLYIVTVDHDHITNNEYRVFLSEAKARAIFDAATEQHKDSMHLFVSFHTVELE